MLHVCCWREGSGGGVGGIVEVVERMAAAVLFWRRFSAILQQRLGKESQNSRCNMG